MKKTISLVLVLVLGLATEVSNADFTFDEPVNVGQPINTEAGDGCPVFTADGLSMFIESDRGGAWDVWVATRETLDDPWGEPLSLNTEDGFAPNISPDGLSLYYTSPKSGGLGQADLYVTTRASEDAPWGEPVNLGPNVNSPGFEDGSQISDDGLTFYFTSDRPGGSWDLDIWMTTRPTVSDPWTEAVNLGPNINTSEWEFGPHVLPGGRVMLFGSGRPGGVGGHDHWMARRKTMSDPWGTPVNLGPIINSEADDRCAFLAADGSVYFHSDRQGPPGSFDIWQAAISPIVDLNGDGIVDYADMYIMVDHWGENYPLCDIGPMPWGDGIVDIHDLIVLVEHLFEGIPPVEPEEVNVDENDDGSQVDLEQGQILVVTLESNPTTGYRWEVAEIQESILEQMGEAEFKPSQTSEPPVSGAGGWEIFRFKAISVGQMTLQLVYHVPWEEGVEPINTFSLQVVVR